jgi:hypothetical protein
MVISFPHTTRPAAFGCQLKHGGGVNIYSATWKLTQLCNIPVQRKKEKEKLCCSETALSEEHSMGGYLYKTFTGTCPEPVKVCDNIPFI